MVDFSQIMDNDAQELAEALRTGEFNEPEEKLCVACNFRLAKENSLFCQMDKCVRGTLEVADKDGTVLFVGLNQLAKEYHTGEVTKPEDYCEECDEYGHNCSGEDFEPEVNDDFPMYMEYDDDNFYDYDTSRMDDDY